MSGRLLVLTVCFASIVGAYNPTNGFTMLATLSGVFLLLDSGRRFRAWCRRG